MSAKHIRFDDDDEEEYELSASDDELTDKHRELLTKALKETEYDSEEEVYGVGSNSENEQNDSDLAVSDVEQDDRDSLPDVRAWGKDKRKFYSTDYVDPDYGGFQGKDASLAELEEEEAKNLQKQLIEELDDNDFSLDIFAKKSVDVKKTKEEVVKTDVSKLSKRQKLEILQKESPEFFGLIEDYKDKMTIAKDYLFPIIKLAKDGKIPESNALEFVKLKYKYILNYSTNIYMYLLLKLSKVNIKNHPVAKRLFQYRKILSQFDFPFESTIKPQIMLMLQENASAESADVSQQKRKTLKVLKKIAKRSLEENTTVASETVPEPPLKKKKVEMQEESSESEDSGVVEKEIGGNAESKTVLEEGEPERRAITYQIAKNKGLTAYKKKELRNPRVKHRNKFRKAKICRKGAVREVRKELSRYGGEISGIKATVSKSIKIK